MCVCATTSQCVYVWRRLIVWVGNPNCVGGVCVAWVETFNCVGREL